MSPLALSPDLLHNVIDNLCKDLPAGALRDVLNQLKSRPTFQEQWPEQWQQGLIQGKKRILKLESIRQDTYTFSDILLQDREIHAWWKSIRTD
jgi:hypothetical protein